MTDRISRKSFLKNGAVFLTGCAVGQSPNGSSLHGRTSLQRPPWPYKPLDAEAVRKGAHDAYYEQGCGYAGFAGILRELQATVGDPFTNLPLEMMSFASGGLKGWGTVCGALNGVCAVISLVCEAKKTGQIIDELMLWYTQSLLPTDAGNVVAAQHGYKVDKGIPALAQTVSGSPLCHVSATKWCAKAGHSIESPERLERCARLSGDVAFFAVKALNESVTGRMQFTRSLAAPTFDCLKCHSPSGQTGDVAAKMDCGQCHQPHSKF